MSEEQFYALLGRLYVRMVQAEEAKKYWLERYDALKEKEKGKEGV